MSPLSDITFVIGIEEGTRKELIPETKQTKWAERNNVTGQGEQVNQNHPDFSLSC